MIKLSISPSILETYRKYYTEEYNGFLTEESVITAVKRETEWSDTMEFGAAFHEIIEFGHEKYYNSVSGLYHIQKKGKEGEVVLPYSAIEPAVIFRKNHPSMVYETPVSFTVCLNGFEVRFKMRIDGIEGNVIHEQKTGKRFSGYEFFEKSLQWKLYILATGANQAQYNIFTWKQLSGKPIQVKYEEPIKLSRYVGIEGDVQDWLDRFLTFCKEKDIIQYITMDHYQKRYGSKKPY